MKAVMISVQPKWVEKIANGNKTIEVRKTRPKIDTPFKCYIYETKGKKVECGFHFEETGRTLRERFVYGMREARIVKHYCNEGQGKVIGEFVCDRILESFLNNNDGWFIEKGCLTQDEIDKYQGDKAILYGWHISNLVIYDEPKALRGFFTPIGKRPSYMLERPPQSWCYVEEKEQKQ